MSQKQNGTSHQNGLHHNTMNNGDHNAPENDLLKRTNGYKNGISGHEHSEVPLPYAKKITFAWCGINAFSVDSSVPRSENCLQCCFGKNDAQIPFKHILKNVSGIAYPGEFLVIMGSSGAGKTTLLNCMTHRNLEGLTVSGSICINNVSVTQKELAAQSAYVQQDDLFIPYLTVKEHLIFQSRLRMDAHFTSKERMQKMEEVMRELSLSKCANNLIGNPGIKKGISGGERKRLALASELLTNPSLLFCDEPTTGLDSFMALNVVQMLKNCASTGRTVIATIHQPSSEVFHIFDKLCLIAEGRTAFLGTTSEANEFFTKLQAPSPPNFNPADHYNQLLSIIPGREAVCRKSVESICDAFQSSSLGVKIEKATGKISKSVRNKESEWFHEKGHINPYKAGWFTQLFALLWRSWLSVIKNPEVTRHRTIVVLCEALLIAIIYFGQTLNQAGIKNLDGVLFLILNSIAFDSAFSVISSFCTELPLFIKEHKDGMYRTDVYYLSKMLCDIPICIIFSILFMGLCYMSVKLNPAVDRFLMSLLIAAALALAATGIGYLVSTLSPDEEIATQRLIIFIVPLLFMGGIYLNLGSIPIYLDWISSFSFFKYSYEALLINQWNDINYIPCSANSNTSSVCIQSGSQVLKINSMNPYNLWPDIGCLFLLAILFRVIGYLILLFKVSRKE
ncbi:hypothetical protein WA026_014506 [Henosepilachna vigintioctopunctata]|uniref:Protein white n=1 Tax=Henosepilachna vigintioctopunctata TaxID=420089 RepID=A0AAW1UC00_9CUCU